MTLRLSPAIAKPHERKLFNQWWPCVRNYFPPDIGQVERVALHEASHTLFALLYGCPRVTLQYHDGRAMTTFPIPWWQQIRARPRDYAKLCLAGIVAEVLFTDIPWRDIYGHTNTDRRIIQKELLYCTDCTTFEDWICSELFSEVKRVLIEYQGVLALLTQAIMESSIGLVTRGEACYVQQGK